MLLGLNGIYAGFRPKIWDFYKKVKHYNSNMVIMMGKKHGLPVDFAFSLRWDIQCLFAFCEVNHRKNKPTGF
jgi:hypothetical protein